jgi:segregation and condensation protein B
LKRELEALLFATDAPLTAGRLKKIFPEAGAGDFKEAVGALQQEYDEAGSAFTVVEFGGGWQIATRPDYAPVVEKLLRTRRVTRLSKAGLEVLAIVAYRQPITRLEVDEIRGVNSSGALATLTERSLITVVGRSQAVGNPLLYGTTREFLNHLGLKALGQLPTLPELEQMVADPDSLKEFASEVGRDVSDEEIDEYFLPEGDASDADEVADDDGGDAMPGADRQAAAANGEELPVPDARDDDTTDLPDEAEDERS